MLVINDFLQVSYLERHASNFINHESFFFFLLVLRFESLLILDKFLLHQNVVFYSLLSQQTQSALRIRKDYKLLILNLTYSRVACVSYRYPAFSFFCQYAEGQLQVFASTPPDVFFFPFHGLQRTCRVVHLFLVHLDPYLSCP